VTSSPPRTRTPQKPPSVPLNISSPQKSPSAQAHQIAAAIVGEIVCEVIGQKLPVDNCHVAQKVSYLDEDQARQLMARLAFYDLDVHEVPTPTGDCLFGAILYILRKQYGVPHWFDLHQVRLAVVHYLVGEEKEFLHKTLDTYLIANKISYYVLCKRLLMAGEWGGLETLLWVRVHLDLTLTVVQPGHDTHYMHNVPMSNVQMVLAYNGKSHYMATGKYCSISFKCSFIIHQS
jgi:hypothetical protein